MTPITRTMLVSAALVAAGALASCSSGKGTAAVSSPGKSAAAASRSTAAASPAATESNPPGDIPDSQAFVPYTPTGAGFRVSVPEGWARTNSGQGVVFTDKYNSVRVDSVASSTAPTVASARSTEVGSVQSAAHGFSPGDVKTVARGAGQAILITYRADSPQNPVTGKVAVEAVERYEFWHSGTEVILTLAGPVGSDNVDPWRKITDSFTWSK